MQIFHPVWVFFYIKIGFLHAFLVRIRYPDEQLRRNCSRLVLDSQNNFCNYIYIYIYIYIYMEVNKEIKFDSMKKSRISKIIQNLMNLLWKTLGFRVMINFLQDLKFMKTVLTTLKTVIITKTFNADFHKKFIKFWIILLFYFSSYLYIYIYICRFAFPFLLLVETWILFSPQLLVI